ncbi:hypothetical protein [Alkalicoccobacillus plakortidis]|uniref:Uncharacterized protein n=1 Tax=Alkalicoccobacillus plakortidis TaxID=444060 RepID=A0ABT0XH98_9BACI|nr:hypothetical protein [Alkalicoccobacillus plakortidis]MCM2675281.1 hypothetical protein [Alkalicoccobacillus plakortidis]
MEKKQEEEWSMNMSESEKEVNQQLMDSYNMGTIEQHKSSTKETKSDRF